MRNPFKKSKPRHRQETVPVLSMPDNPYATSNGWKSLGTAPMTVEEHADQIIDTLYPERRLLAEGFEGWDVEATLSQLD